MSKDHLRPDKASEPDTSEDRLLIEDLVRYLSHLAKLNREPRTGNAELSDGLRDLATVLRPYSNRPLHEVVNVVGTPLPKKRKAASKKPKATLPSDIPSLSDQRVEEILNDHSYTKAQLIEVGIQRFGISRSRLMRLPKNEVTESVRAALNHERSLGVISQEARRGGERRTS